jgi:hypothetical protein
VIIDYARGWDTTKEGGMPDEIMEISDEQMAQFNVADRRASELHRQLEAVPFADYKERHRIWQQIMAADATRFAIAPPAVEPLR